MVKNLKKLLDRGLSICQYTLKRLNDMRSSQNAGALALSVAVTWLLLERHQRGWRWALVLMGAAVIAFWVFVVMHVYYWRGRP
jgi:hypothetical protein